MYGDGEVDEEYDDDYNNRTFDLERRRWEDARKAFSEFEREALDHRLDELRIGSPKDGVALPLDNDTAWMTEEERNCVEWFDRRDYDTFMKRSAWYEGDGWIVPYCRMVCGEKNLASCEVLSDYANDYDSSCDFELDGLGKCTVCEGASRKERFVRVADKIFVAAKTGNARAQNTVGIFCENGNPNCDKTLLLRNLGIEKYNSVAAREWYRKSAEGGCIQGIRNYARFLRNGQGRDTDFRLPDGSYDRAALKMEKAEAERWYRVASDRGDGESRYDLACMYADGRCFSRDVGKCADWLKFAALAGHSKAKAIVRTAGEDAPAERLCAELLVSWAAERLANRALPNQQVSWDLTIRADICKGEGRKKSAKHDTAWLLSGRPQGTVAPPPSSREMVRTPNLSSANPSFAALLIGYVRDRFGGDAPTVYRAAHVSRKTYSAIISNELRAVSKPTAIAFALALGLSDKEFTGFIRSAGYALSDFILGDMIVRACILSGIHDISKVDEILVSHGVEPLGCQD